MIHFTLGHINRTAVQLDLPRLVDTRALVQANSGGGKSWLLRLIAERAAKHVQVIILDPEGEFATLREKFDFALVGRGGEVAAEVRTANLLARKLTELHCSTVIDLYDLDLEAKREFVSDFLNALLSVPRAQWHPLLVMLDEAHKFCPEKGDVASTRAVINLMDSGRKRGFAGIIATQRLSKLHKDAAAEANNVFIGRTWLDLDQERAGDLLGMRKADRTQLRDLAPGEFFAFGPALSVAGVNRFKSDSVATTHPQPGARHQLVIPKASDAIREIVQQLDDLPVQATEEANVLTTLRNENAQLKRELAARPVQLQPQVERVVEKIEVPIFKDGEVSRLEKSINGLMDVSVQFFSFSQQLNDAVKEIAPALKQAAATPHPFPAPRPAPSFPRPAPRPASLGVEATSGHIAPQPLAKAERAILSVLAQYHPAGRTKTQLAILSGYAVNGGGFGNAVSAMRSVGYLVGNKEQLTITDVGLAALGQWEPLPSGRALIDYWLHTLAKAERACLNVLVECYPSALPRDEVCTRAGYTPGTGGVNNALSRLRTLELITGRNELKASDALME